MSFTYPVSLLQLEHLFLSLELTRLLDGDASVDLARLRAKLLDSLDDLHGLVVSNLAKDDVLAVEPRGDDGGDEKLGAVAIDVVSHDICKEGENNVRVLAGVGHGQETWLGVLQLEVLVLELLAIDGLAARALQPSHVSHISLHSNAFRALSDMSYVTTGEVTTLKHELRDDTVEPGAGIAEALIAGAQGAEVLGGLGNDVVEEVELDAAVGSAVGRLDVEVAVFQSICHQYRDRTDGTHT
jgi:hypothetical protein